MVLVRDLRRYLARIVMCTLENVRTGLCDIFYVLIHSEHDVLLFPVLYTNISYPVETL